jgi:hypothetical protein
MLIYLDNAGSRRQAPNENFAREVMELFTLGEGHYGERDVKEAARAFTGWSLDRDAASSATARLARRGEKTVLGRTGRFDGDGVLDILLARPETAQFIARKLWREFVSPTPDAARSSAGRARSASRATSEAAAARVLTSDAFWAPAIARALIKSPVDLVVGTLRTFEIRPDDCVPPRSPPRRSAEPVLAAEREGLARRRGVDRLRTLLGRKQFSSASSAAPTVPWACARPSMGESARRRDARMRRVLERGMADYASTRHAGRVSRAASRERSCSPPPPVNAPAERRRRGARARPRRRSGLPAQ